MLLLSVPDFINLSDLLYNLGTSIKCRDQTSMLKYDVFLFGSCPSDCGPMWAQAWGRAAARGGAGAVYRGLTLRRHARRPLRPGQQ
jgi:hypothetical protein